MNNRVYRVLLADDHSLILEGLIKQLEISPLFDVIGVANNGKEAWEYYNHGKPDLCILDIEMSVFDGIELTEKIKNNNPDTKVVLLTMHKSPWIIAKAKKAMPDCILLKSMACKEILFALSQVVEQGHYYNAEVERLVKQNTPEIIGIQSLSVREIEVLRLISEGLTTQQIAEKIFLSVNTIETYRKNLLLKFDTPNMASMIKKALELGVI